MLTMRDVFALSVFTVRAQFALLVTMTQAASYLFCSTSFIDERVLLFLVTGSLSIVTYRVAPSFIENTSLVR